MAFADTDALAAYLNVEFSATTLAVAEQALDLATDAIRALASTDLDEVTETVLLHGHASGSPTIILPDPYPITAVTLVELLDPDFTTWRPLVYQQDWTWTETGILTRVMSASDVVNVPIVNWPSRPRSVRVTYQHGWATVPAPLIGVCLSIAARLFTNPTDLVDLNVDGFSERYRTNKDSADFTAAEERIIGAYREVVVA